MTTKRLLTAAVVVVLLAVGANTWLGLDNYGRVRSVIVQSRQEGCEAAERLRVIVREELVEEKAQLPKTLKLLKLTTPEQIAEAKAIGEARAMRRAARAAPVDCIAYGHKAIARLAGG